MSTTIIRKTKVSIGAIEPSMLAIDFDIGIPQGTTARVDVSADVGFIFPKLFILTTDPQVEATVYVQLDGSEVKLFSLDEDSSIEVDVDEVYGELQAKRIILEGKVKTDTTELRKITLKYSGGIFDFR